MQSQRTEYKPVSLGPYIVITCMSIERRVTKSPLTLLINFTITRGKRNSDNRLYSSSRQNSNPAPHPEKRNPKHQLNKTPLWSLSKLRMHQIMCISADCANSSLHLTEIPHRVNLFSILHNVNKWKTNQHFPFLKSRCWGQQTIVPKYPFHACHVDDLPKMNLKGDFAEPRYEEVLLWHFLFYFGSLF